MRAVFSAVLFLLAWSLGSAQGQPSAPDAPLPRKAVFGAQLLVPTVEQRAAAKINADEGLVLGAIVPGQSAELAKLATGDLLLKIDGIVLKTAADFNKIMRTKNGGASVEIEYWRDGKLEQATVKLVERPKQKPDGFEVLYDQVTSIGKRIRMIVTRPPGSGKLPAVMLVGGIGNYSVDGDFQNVAYGSIMGPIAKAGYATIRIDKPGIGDSEGPVYTDLDFQTELDAYRQALKKAKTLDFIDPDRIFIFGHSMGGAFGPILVSENPIRGIAVCGTVCKTWTEYFIENNRRQALLGGATHAQVGASLNKLTAFFTYLFYEGKTIEQIVQQHPELADTARSQSPDGKTMSGVGIPFFRQLSLINFEDYWSKVDAYTLAIWCENDFISTEEDHPMIAAIVNGAHAGKGKYVRLANSDHAFMTSTSFADSLSHWGQGGRVFNPNIVETVLGWLKDVDVRKTSESANSVAADLGR